MNVEISKGDVPKRLREEDMWLNYKEEDGEEIPVAPYKTKDIVKVGPSKESNHTSFSEAKKASEEEGVGIGFYYKDTFIPLNENVIEDFKKMEEGRNIELKVDALEQYLHKFTSSEKNEFEKVKVSDLRASHIGKKVEANVQIAGDKRQKAISEKLLAKCFKCGWTGETYRLLEDYELLKYYLLGNKKDWQNKVRPYECPGCERKPTTIVEEDNIDLSILHIRDLIEAHEKFEESNYETVKIYLVGKTVPPSKKVTVRGKVIRNPKTRDISIIAKDIEPYEDIVEDFEIDERDKKNFEKYFKEKDMEELKNQIAPDMVGRPFVQKSRLLVLHSVAEIPFLKERIGRGCLREVLFGDTTTYKSASIRDITEENYGIGSLIHGSTSGRTGLLYTINPEERTLIWGEIPLNDLGYVGLDEVHLLDQQEVGELRTALRDQTVKVSQMVSGEAKTRVRMSSTLNPGKKGEKPLNEYLFNCQAIKDTWIFQNPPDVARWDIFIPFCDEDVSESEISNRGKKERPVPDDVFMSHIHWAWSREPDQVEYTTETEERIKSHSESFMKKYSFSRLPIINKSFRENLTRLSVAHAALNHSTDEEHERVVVEPRHVEESIELYREMLEQLDYIEYKDKIEGEKRLTDEKFSELIGDMDGKHIDVLEEVSGGAKSSKEIARKIGKSERTVKRIYPLLKEHNLLKTRRGVGSELTPKGVNFLKKLIKKPEGEEYEELVTESGTMSLGKEGRGSKNGEDGGKKGTPTQSPSDKVTKTGTKSGKEDIENSCKDKDRGKRDAHSQREVIKNFFNLLEVENLGEEEAIEFFENRRKDAGQYLEHS